MSSRKSDYPVYGAGETAVGAALTSGAIPVAVYGLGKMGLPLAAIFADVTGNVRGVDIDPAVVEQINAGECHVTGEPGLPELVAETVGDGALEATTDPADAASDARLHVVIVPTLLTDDNEPDLTLLQAAIESIADGLSAGDMVVVESTVPPNTCRDVVHESLVEQSDLTAGEFGLAFCPERTSSGRALTDIRGAYPKVVGGIDDESTAVAASIYRQITDNDVLTVSSTQTAEAVKVFEGLYRDVNIALANELAQIADPLGLDVMEAIETANTQPFCDLHTPGPGVGGHCIPYYPYFVTSQVDRTLSLVETARSVNDGMPTYVVETVCDRLETLGVSPADSTVLVLGATYRAGVRETRKSPAGPITEGLSARGSTVYLADPMLDDAALGEFAADPVATDDVSALDPDAVVLVTAHDAFERLDWDEFGEALLVDTRQSIQDPRPPAYVLGRGDVAASTTEQP